MGVPFTEEDTKDAWFQYALQVFEDSRAALLKYAKDKHFGLKPANKRLDFLYVLFLILRKGNTLAEDQFKLELDKKVGSLANLLYEKVFSTFFYETMFNLPSIAYIDEYIKDSWVFEFFFFLK